jgi:hypothetical protein
MMTRRASEVRRVFHARHPEIQGLWRLDTRLKHVKQGDGGAARDRQRSFFLHYQTLAY